LTNYEVLEALTSQLNKDNEAMLAGQKLSKSINQIVVENEVRKYLNNTPSSTQTTKSIKECLEKLEPYQLTKSEVQQIINLRPSTHVEISFIVECCDERLSEQNAANIINIIDSTLPEFIMLDRDDIATTTQDS